MTAKNDNGQCRQTTGESQGADFAVDSDGPAAQAGGMTEELALRQSEIDALPPADYYAFRATGTGLTDDEKARWFAKYPALRRYDEAYDKVFREVAETKVEGPRPAVWYVYNMGLVVKTRETLFAIDLAHRQAMRSVPLLDFACITHNHEDHYGDDYLQALDRLHKVVINNFDDNYGARSSTGGYGGFTKRGKTFYFGDVEIATHVTSHNNYLIDYTLAMEITVGDFVIYHTGDSAIPFELKPNHEHPDLWVVHPYNYMKVGDGVQIVKPKMTCLGHLQELGHEKGGARWTYEQGLQAIADCREQGYEAIMPLWGDRLV